MINSINVYNCEEDRKISFMLHSRKKKLEGIIIEVSKTLMGIEKGETGNGSKAKEDWSRKEQKALH